MRSSPGAFPNTAQDYAESTLDLNDFCIIHPSATYFFKADGESMSDAGILSGDLLVVDRALTPVHGDTVVASVEGEFVIRRLCTHPRLCLQPMNPAYPTMFIAPDELDIVGVVTHAIHTLPRG
ncbi:translesion error-prone DNA polymerase V autoproteolytic subunit [Yersinia ruckeri]|uniref:translesion error-prone DNA polymerase V autoproteolytic subunit n=1 Tax=Yersinia ruckeri TaxID=29486 RepID=UPI001F3155FB|nr:translesion error-prone DNA polymerase V autoproteolytic subunit [Yersinia ruckeri]UIN02622.1 translesion error-prone DNA polymerase V autoproteolytic subunit [Yersinia ruckeri]